MQWKSLKAKEEIMNKFLEYMYKHGDEYDDVIAKELSENFMDNIGENRVYSEFTQLYDELGALPPCGNAYIAYLDMIIKNFDITGNILEVGGGAIPSFAKKVAKKQIELGKGTITVYDPRLLSVTYEEYPNMILKKQECNNKIDISEYDLLLGIMPCLGTDNMLELIEKYKKDFFVALCGCDHDAYRLGYYKYGFYRPSYYDYINYAKEICEENNRELVQDFLPDRFDISYPVIYSKRKQG